MSTTERCPNCYARLYGGQSQIAHETSGRCSARENDFGNVVSIHKVTRRAAAEGRRRPSKHVPDGQRRRAVEAPHGTESRYSSDKWHCRCPECTEAHAEYNRGREQIKRRNRPAPEHGTRSRYTSKKWLCRCEACTAADTAYNLALREAKRARDQVRSQHADVG